MASWFSEKKDDVGNWFGDKAGNLGNWLGDKASDAGSSVKDWGIKVAENATDIDIDGNGQTGDKPPEPEDPNNPDDGKWYDFFKPKNGDGLINIKSGIGAFIGGVLGMMLSGPLKLIMWPLKQLVGFIPGIGKPLEMLSGALTSKFGAAAGGAGLGVLIANKFFGGEESPDTKPDNAPKSKAPAIPAPKTSKKILAELSGIFENGVTPQETPQVKSLLAEFKATDPAGHAALAEANKASFKDLGLN